MPKLCYAADIDIMSKNFLPKGMKNLEISTLGLRLHKLFVGHADGVACGHVVAHLAADFLQKKTATAFLTVELGVACLQEKRNDTYREI